jgi:hypothetical protein
VPPNAVEPGTRLVDRYRLDKHLGEAAGTSYWRAHDELLDRPVGVCLLDADASQADRVLRAARRASGVTDPRFLRVLDASEVEGPLGTVVYVVNEWVRATNLTDLLADGPLKPAEARELTQEIADALASAHGEGLSHLCLQPEHVLRTSHGQVKIVGLAVEAAVRGVEADDPDDAARRDARGAASIGYAALTARWPGPEATGLAAAPHDGDALCSPRQVRAGIPHDLDQVVGRTLGVPGSGGDPVVTPARLASALGDAHVTSRIPAVPPAGSTGTDSFPPGRLAPYDDNGRRRPSRTTVLAWAVVARVLCVGLGLAGGQVLTSLGGDGSGPSTGDDTSSPSGTSSPTGDPLEVTAVTSFDPPPDGNGDENGYAAELAVDGKRSTVWTTKEYNDQFGPSGLKDGVGLVLDLGQPTDISAVTIRTEGATGLEVRTADQEGATLDDYTRMAQASNVDGNAVLRPKGDLTARYVLVWLTSLPADGGRFRGSIVEISVRG